MKPVFQTIVDSVNGDCQRAAVASILELDIHQVPHFILYEGHEWYRMFLAFMDVMGYQYHGIVRDEHIATLPTIDGAIIASVKSKLYPGGSHAVLINNEGIVIHDPNPNKAYLGENVIETKSMYGAYKFTPGKKKTLTELWVGE